MRVAEDRARFVPRRYPEVAPLKQDFALRNPDRARQHAEQRLDDRGFAGATLADEPVRFAGCEIQAHIAQDWLGVREF